MVLRLRSHFVSIVATVNFDPCLMMSSKAWHLTLGPSPCRVFVLRARVYTDYKYDDEAILSCPSTQPDSCTVQGLNLVDSSVATVACFIVTLYRVFFAPPPITLVQPHD